MPPLWEPSPRLRRSSVRANGIQFATLEIGTGPLALCLHGFPDSAYTWRHLLPELAQAGFHAVAPFTRGYAPTELAPDGCYQLGALVADAVALHEALGGDEQAVLIGHDWGAETAYGAAAIAPRRWRRLVTLAVPPLSLDDQIFSDYDQLKRLFYLFFFKTADAESVVAADDLAFLERLWQDWSPGFDATEAIGYAKASIRQPEHLLAALGYYRATEPFPHGARPALAYPDEHAALLTTPPQPTLYLHGDRDGCIDQRIARRAEPLLAAGSRLDVIEGAGHFLQVEQPVEVNTRIIDWVCEARIEPEA